MACGCNRRNNGCSFMEWCFEFLCEDDEPETFCDVGYFYRKTGGSIDAGDPFTFDDAETYGGVTFDIGTSASEMKIANTGIYRITYFVKSQTANAKEVGLELNGGGVISNTIYSPGPDKFVYGQAIINVTQSNSILELITNDIFTISKGSVDDVVASVIVEKICEPQV